MHRAGPRPRRRILVALVVVALALVVAGCKKKPLIVISETTTSPFPLPTATASPPSSPTGVLIADPAVAAQGLFDAWTRNDRVAAALYASQAAIDALFANPFSSPAPTFQGCNPSGAEVLCSYTYEGGAISMSVTGSASAGYRVNSVGFIAD